MPALPVGDPDWYQAEALATIGGTIGLILANVLLWRKWIPRSFAQMEEAAIKKEEGKAADQPAVTPLQTVSRKRPILITAFLVFAAMVVCWLTLRPSIAAAVTLGGGVLLFLLGVLPRDAGTVDVTQDVVDEISGPNVRSEMLKELLFVAIPILFALVAVSLQIDVSRAPWVERLLGSMAGFLAGGGVVWIIRIGASLAFNKEAMGLGDAHLMAAVGAVIGAPLVVMGFFMAPFLGLIWGITLKIMGKPNVLPYGPWLSIACLFSVLYGATIWAAIQLLLAPPGH